MPVNKRHIDVADFCDKRDQNSKSPGGGLKIVDNSIANEDLNFSLGTTTQIEGGNNNHDNSQTYQSNVQSRSSTPHTLLQSNNNNNQMPPNSMQFPKINSNLQHDQQLQEF